MVHSCEASRVFVQRFVLIHHSPNIGVCLPWLNAFRLAAWEQNCDVPLNKELTKEPVRMLCGSGARKYQYFLLGSWLPPLTSLLSARVGRCCRAWRPCSWKQSASGQRNEWRHAVWRQGQTLLLLTWGRAKEGRRFLGQSFILNANRDTTAALMSTFNKRNKYYGHTLYWKKHFNTGPWLERWCWSQTG